MRNVIFFVFLFCVAGILFSPSWAQTQPDHFTVVISGVGYSDTSNVSPCFPVMAYFSHPNGNVTKVKMRYPYNHNMFMIFDIDETVHIDLHEKYMRAGQWSLSDFIALDDDGLEYGAFTLTFVPPENPEDHKCSGLVS